MRYAPGSDLGEYRREGEGHPRDATENRARAEERVSATWRVGDASVTWRGDGGALLPRGGSSTTRYVSPSLIFVDETASDKPEPEQTAERGTDGHGGDEVTGGHCDAEDNHLGGGRQ